MAAFSCPHCEKPFSVPATMPDAQVRCPHCREPVTLPKTPASRWFYARAKKKYGPYTWQQLQTLAQRGDLAAADMLLQEGTKQWVRADTLPRLFPEKPPVAKPHPFPWTIVALAGAGAAIFVGVCTLMYFLFLRPSPAAVNPGSIAEQKIDPPVKVDPPKKNVAPLKNDDDKKPPPKKPPEVGRPAWTEQFVERLNRQRKYAGLATVALDAELSRGCAAHAKYLAQNIDPATADVASIYDEDAKKTGFTIEGRLAGQNALIAFAEPLDAFDKWLGRLHGRAALLAPPMRSIGIGFEKSAKGDWFCVVDPVRGRGEPVVVFPAPQQIDVPLSFTSGPEVRDAKAVAGFPITVTFPPTRKVSGVSIELQLDKKRIDGWTWTPEKPLRPGGQHNTIVLIPKGLLRGSTTYHVKATAQVDAQPWALAWSFTTEDDRDTKGVWAKKALAKVNTYRAQAGLKPVELDANLSRGCLAHARYLVINEGHPALEGLKAHDEDPNLPGFSEEGRAAGKASDIATGDNEPTDGVDGWIATLYHRVPILDPALTRIGFGCARGQRQGWVTVMNVSTGRDKAMQAAPVFYPVADQTDVPLSFPNGGEEPNPIPEDKTGRAGFPITATFPIGAPLKNAVGKVTDAKGEVPCWFSTPQNRANPDVKQGTTVCLIPKAPLAASKTYHVHLQGEIAGKAWEKKWKFTTGAGLSVKDATRQVLDRLNAYRTQAGLGAVALDDALTFGCQRHAEYLVLNADVLAKKNAPVNDEDANLPGFTREGLRAAQQSDVFSNAPTPVVQIDDLMATFTRRVYLLDPNLQRIGFGCAHDIGRGWRCVLDTTGKGETRVVVFPAPLQNDVPTVGYDTLKGAKANPGFPINVAFPRQASVTKVEALLKDAADKEVDIVVTTPEQPLNATPQRGLIGVHPRTPLQPGHTYTVTVSAIVNASEWRQTWQFTTAR